MKKKVILPCRGTRENKHYEVEGKLYGFHPMAHCDTSCPYESGSCVETCSNVPIAKRACLKEDYIEEEE